MKDAKLLIWLTQLGLSVAVPLGGFIALGVWLHRQHQWGSWVVVAGVILGLLCAVDGLYTSLKAAARMGENKKKEVPPVSFNEHE